MTRTGLFSSWGGVKYFAALTLMLSVAFVCAAQDANQSQAPQPAAAPAPEQPERVDMVTAGAEPNDDQLKTDVLTPLEQQMRKTVSVEFKETPIADAVKQLAQQADVDIILSPKVVGNVTATLTDVPLDEAMNNILAVQGAAYVTSKNMIRVVPIGELSLEQAKTVTKVFRIKYADVKDVAAALEKFISKSGQMSFAVGTSNIIVTDTEDKVKDIEKFLNEIDRITPQVLVEARLYDISTADHLDLGVQWSVGTKTDYGETGELGSLDKDGRTDPFMTGAVGSAVGSKTDLDSDQFRFGWLNGSVNIDAIIAAKQRDITAKLLANPRVMVIDNEEALIKIVQEIPYQELSQTSGGGNIGTTQFKEVGVELRVKPHVTDQNMIRMRLRPAFSTKGQSQQVVIPVGVTVQVSEIPGIDKRETETTALVKDGQTVVLGGLRKKETVTDLNKIPLLGDIPLIGFLFRFQGDTVRNSELVVFVTPRIVVAPTLSAGEEENWQKTNFAPPLDREQKMLNKLKKD